MCVCLCVCGHAHFQSYVSVHGWTAISYHSRGYMYLHVQWQIDHISSYIGYVVKIYPPWRATPWNNLAQVHISYCEGVVYIIQTKAGS